MWPGERSTTRACATSSSIDPDTMGGTPVIKGTRVPVRTLAQLVAGGESREALKEDYPPTFPRRPTTSPCCGRRAIHVEAGRGQIGRVEGCCYSVDQIV